MNGYVYSQDSLKRELANKMIECALELHSYCNLTHCDKCVFHDRNQDYCLIRTPLKWGSNSKLSIRELLTP